MRSILPSFVSHSSQSCAWIFRVGERDRGPHQRQLLVLGVDPQRHRRAGAEPRQQEIVGRRPGIEPAGGDRLVGGQPVRAGRDRLLEFAAVRLASPSAAALRCRPRPRGGRDSGRPRRQSRSRHRARRSFGEQVIGTGERDEALRMLGGREDVRGVVDADGVVGRRMEDQQRLAQLGDAFGQLLLGHVVEEFAADAERPAGERDLDLAVLADGIELAP